MGSTDRYCLDMCCRDKIQTTTAHLQEVLGLYSPCQICASSLQPMSIFYPMFTAHFREPSISTAQTLTVPFLCGTSTAIVQSVHHLSLLSMFIQYTISPANIQSIHYLYCPCLVTAPYLLHMSNPFCRYPVSESYHLLMSRL